MQLTRADVQIVHQPAEHYFEATIQGAQIGTANYRMTGKIMALTHTMVDPEYRGQGIADQLVHTALEYARAEGFTVKPVCWFVELYIQRHPQYWALVHQ
jgi:uncharacterized protein